MNTSTSPVYDEVLIALTDTPKTTTEIAGEIGAIMGRPVTVGSVSRAIKKAAIRGAATRAGKGWVEPDDCLSPVRKGARP